MCVCMVHASTVFSKLAIQFLGVDSPPGSWRWWFWWSVQRLGGLVKICLKQIIWWNYFDRVAGDLEPSSALRLNPACPAYKAVKCIGPVGCHWKPAIANQYERCLAPMIVAQKLGQHDTDLARRWESVPELRRRAKTMELVGSSYMLDTCSGHILGSLKTAVLFFPTCQVRVVRFYQSACPPPPPPSPPPPPRLAVLLALLLASASSTSHFRLAPLHFRLANLADSSPSASPTSQLSGFCWTSTCELPSSVCTAGPQPASCPAQCALLDVNLRAAQLSVHRWTSICELPSSVCTAGPQPGTFPAQCARWTSTWDLPSSVCTAGPQRPDRMPEDMPDRNVR